MQTTSLKDARKLSRKILPIYQQKTGEAEGKVVIEGYANTKNRPDRYGDVPSVMKKARNYVYDLTEFKKNPVLLIDHVNSVEYIAGSVTLIKEDETGLFFRAEFSASEYPLTAHVRRLYQEGHAKGISIAGKFHHEDEENPALLTLAEIYEISLVALPADPSALAAAMENAAKNLRTAGADEQSTASELHALKSSIDRWLSDLRNEKTAGDIRRMIKDLAQ